MSQIRTRLAAGASRIRTLGPTPLTRRQTHGSDRMNGAERDTVVGSGSLVTLDPGAAKREIARSFPVRPWALSQARGA
jgi:hypothetical protein